MCTQFVAIDGIFQTAAIVDVAAEVEKMMLLPPLLLPVFYLDPLGGYIPPRPGRHPLAK